MQKKVELHFTLEYDTEHQGEMGLINHFSLRIQANPPNQALSKGEVVAMVAGWLGDVRQKLTEKEFSILISAVEFSIMGMGSVDLNKLSNDLALSKETFPEEFDGQNSGFKLPLI